VVWEFGEEGKNKITTRHRVAVAFHQHLTVLSGFRPSVAHLLIINPSPWRERERERERDRERGVGGDISGIETRGTKMADE